MYSLKETITFALNYLSVTDGKDNFKLEKREPTAKRRKTGQVTDDYYHTMGVPDNVSKLLVPYK